MANDPKGHVATLHAEDWAVIREKWTNQAIVEGDIPTLRKLSALPGGFGGDEIRKRVWPVLLKTHRLDEEAPTHPDNSQSDSKSESKETASGPAVSSVSSKYPSHKDETQVKLDTNRSFVTYPKGIPLQSKVDLQNDLQDLIVGVLRKYPALSYFQGYHDILSVLYLTFIPPKLQAVSTPSTSQGKPPNNDETETESVVDNEKISNDPLPYDGRDTPEWQELRKCAAIVSLHRVRDAMGSGMEGMMGLLRILKRILRAADPELSRFSAQISPVPTLPFFALSWVLTLFSHDCDSLQPIQRMFDFLLARNPISAVYLAAAILIAKKPQMSQMAKDLGSEYHEDPSLLHPLFVRLPPLYNDTPISPNPPATGTTCQADSFVEEDANPYDPIKLSELFKLTDSLMERYPWGGEVIKGKEILGEGSVVCSYDIEMSNVHWSSQDALALIDVGVVQPGAGMLDDEDEDETPLSLRPTRRRLFLRLPKQKLSTILALGVVILGVGMAVYGVKAGGPEAKWGRWWGMVIRGWVGKESGRFGDGWARLIGFVSRSLRDVV
nr:uncharacterized protein CI109_002270 [Kwoniella shandongensis]KAA5529377.1 hypothetical protein CI109_002270 [Kwoniella shandongensis]